MVDLPFSSVRGSSWLLLKATEPRSNQVRLETVRVGSTRWLASRALREPEENLFGHDCRPKLGQNRVQKPLNRRSPLAGLPNLRLECTPFA